MTTDTGTSTRLVGAPLPRVEDPRLLTGGGRYLDDLGPDARAAAFVRSPHAHARITGIDASGATGLDGVLAVYTHKDLTGPMAEPLPVLIPFGLSHARTTHALAKEFVHHVGEPVVMVVARDRYIAEDACQQIQVDYDVLPAVVGIEGARRADHLVHPDVPGNIAAHVVQEVGDAPAEIAAATHTLTLHLDIERSACMPMEGRGVYARWEPVDGGLRLYTSTQNAAGVRAAVATILELPPSRVEVVTPDVGGAFGVKIIHPWPEEVLLPWAARRLGNEIKWVEDRLEHFTSSAHERQQLQTVRVGFNDDGRILGLDVDIQHDTGSYTPYGIVVPFITSTQLLGPYKPGAYRVELTCLYTNTVMVTPYRGAGGPQGVYAMERTMDAIARHLHKDRTDIRQANLIRPEDMPYDQGLIFGDGRPLIYDSGDYPASLQRIKEMIRWDDFATYRAHARAEGRTVGIGISCCVEPTGFGPYEGAHVQIDTTGTVMVATGLTSQGQGHHTAFAQIAAEELGVPLHHVHVTTGDTRRFPYSMGTFASRAAVMAGNAIADAARKVKDKALQTAAEALHTDPADLELAHGQIRAKNDPQTTLPLGTVAALCDPIRYPFDPAARAAAQYDTPADFTTPPLPSDYQTGLQSTGHHSPLRSTFAHAMHAAIVETDPATAEVRILRYCVVHDCGRQINPLIVEGQLHGAVAQGIAGALFERLHYDTKGQLLNTSFRDFLMPYATEIPTIEITRIETPSPLNPLAVKGAGESGINPVYAVLASAIEDAEDIPIQRMPISPSELLALRTQHKTNPAPPEQPGPTTDETPWPQAA
ncbi:aerobic carbon-monoxide dehydrogenase large subunit [Streptomyces sp. NPDC015127]|uniref:aerobic carbon-monoxide dehydrogenase large subunit n=1 Tax=Streptomyces sp. NPDC015127 TaxID=3364939 RepID=UPI00370041AF